MDKDLRRRWRGWRQARREAALNPVDRERLMVLRAVSELMAQSPAGLLWLLRFFDELPVAAGQTVAREGEPCRMFAVVLEGQLRRPAAGPPGAALNAGGSLGWGAMWDRRRSDATWLAETDSRLLVMGHSQFRAAKSACPGLATIAGPQPVHFAAERTGRRRRMPVPGDATRA